MTSATISDEIKFDRVLIAYDAQPKNMDRSNWENMDIEEQRELLALGRVRFFKEETEIPFYRALL